jgi:hypothetical protein
VDEREREKQSREALERVARESETIGTSSLARVCRRLGDHFAGADAVDDTGGGSDPIELWGRRIGRALSLIGVVVLGYWLGAQLRLW